MGVEPPYLYERPSVTSFTTPSDRGFSPKAVTEASWAPREPPPQQEVPLVNARDMNRHPDSYFIIPYGNLNWKPMGKSTKSKIKWMRIVLLNLRICTLVGAVGLLFCIICIRPTGASVDWIIRIAPAVAFLHSVYAVYHLSRPAKSRTPASTASYMVFAAVFDAGIVPFLAFTAYMANGQYFESANTDGHWQTLFPQEFQTTTIIYATYLICLAAGGAHVVAFVFTIYLATLFHKIMKLPPDMNPLEDNLTSRHKRNKSSISVMSTQPAMAGNTPERPLMEKPRTKPFMDTRHDLVGAPGSGPHRRSGAPSARGSQVDFHAIPYSSMPGSARSSHTDLRRSPQHATKRNTLPQQPRTSPEARPARPHTMHEGAFNENWSMHPSPPPSPTHLRSGPQPPELQHLRAGRGAGPEVSLPQPHERKAQDFANRSPKPLGMNPPTPTQAAEYARNPYRSPTREGRQALRDLVNSQTMRSSPAAWEEVSLRPSHARVAEEVTPAEAGGRGKGRFYGSLRGMIGGRRSGGRVVSSGRDDGMERMGLRGREVSGKIAEEGRNVVQH